MLQFIEVFSGREASRTVQSNGRTLRYASRSAVAPVDPEIGEPGYIDLNQANPSVAPYSRSGHRERGIAWRVRQNVKQGRPGFGGFPPPIGWANIGVRGLPATWWQG